MDTRWGNIFWEIGSKLFLSIFGYKVSEKALRTEDILFILTKHHKNMFTLVKNSRMKNYQSSGWG